MTTEVMQQISEKHPYICFLQDDPIRPHLSASERLASGGEIWLLRSETKPLALTCLRWCSDVPASEEELASFSSSSSSSATIAVFYTIWSYQPGSAGRLLSLLRSHLVSKASKMVTLSPKTEMARRFHHKHGATTYRENSGTINYEYFLAQQ